MLRDRLQRAPVTDPPIATVAELAELADRLMAAERVALDLEGDGLFRYRSRLCTLQLKLDDEVVLVDTLAAWDPELMAAALGPGGPLKIIHDAAFDARLLFAHGVQLGNVFDTALAARYLAAPATGLSALVQAHCGVEIDKGKQQADWGRRPLEDADLAYLRGDVEFLFTLHDGLREELATAAIEAEYAAEVDYMLAQALLPPRGPSEPWMRIKGHRELRPAQRAVLRETARVREAAAEKQDVPLFRIMHDRVLLSVAERCPRSRGALKRIRGAADGRATSLVDDMLQAIERGLSAGVVPDDETTEAYPRAPAATERKEKRQRQKALTAWRKTTAEARGVDPQIVLPGHCLQDLVAMCPGALPELAEVAGLGDVRVQRDGVAILEVLAQTGEKPRDTPPDVG